MEAKKTPEKGDRLKKDLPEMETFITRTARWG